MIVFGTFFEQWHGSPLSEKLSVYLNNKIKLMDHMNTNQITECEYDVFEQCFNEQGVALSTCREKTIAYRSIMEQLETGEITDENAIFSLKSLDLLHD